AATAEAAALLDRLRESLGSLTVTTRPDWTFDPASARGALYGHFNVSTLAGFGFDDEQPCIAAAGALLLYLQETVTTALVHLPGPRPYREQKPLSREGGPRRSLELTRTLRDGSRDGSLLSVLDRTATPMGARLLMAWLLAPLAERPAIESRLEAVSELLDEH